MAQTMTVEQQLEDADRRWLGHWKEGPKRTRLDRLAPQVGEQAPDLELTSSEGERVRLSNVWSKGTVHLFVMRQYGCGCMKERWAQLQDDYPKLSDAGATLVPIGSGEPERTKLFIEDRNIPVPVLCDPEGKAYDAYGITEGTVPTILHDYNWQPGDDEGGRKLMAGRAPDLKLVDNPWILPAEFIIDRGGVIRHAHRYQYCEDYPPVSVLLGAVNAARR